MKRQFLHLSDIHYLADYSGSGSFYSKIFERLTPPVTQLRNLLKRVDLKNVDLIIISGDLTESGTVTDYEKLKAQLKGIFGNTPIIVTPGNHDNIETLKKGWFGESPADSDSCNILVSEAGINVICLDSSSKEHPDGIITHEDCSWLEKILMVSKGTPTILITHHHLLDNQFSMPRADYPDKFVELIYSSGIIGIFNGHTHHFFRGEFAGKPYYTADSLSFSGESHVDGYTYFVERSGLSVFELEHGKLSVNRIGGKQITKCFGAFIAPKPPATV